MCLEVTLTTQEGVLSLACCHLHHREDDMGWWLPCPRADLHQDHAQPWSLLIPGLWGNPVLMLGPHLVPNRESSRPQQPVLPTHATCTRHHCGRPECPAPHGSPACSSDASVRPPAVGRTWGQGLCAKLHPARGTTEGFGRPGGLTGQERLWGRGRRILGQVKRALSSSSVSGSHLGT